MVSRTRRECWQRYEHMSSGGTTRPQGRRAPSYAAVLPLALRASMPVCVACERSLRSELWLDWTRIRPRARKRGCCIGPWPWKGRQMHGSSNRNLRCYGHSTLTFLSTLPQPSFHEASSAAWAANRVYTILRVNDSDIPNVAAPTACTSI